MKISLKNISVNSIQLNKFDNWNDNKKLTISVTKSHEVSKSNAISWQSSNESLRQLIKQEIIELFGEILGKIVWKNISGIVKVRELFLQLI